MASVEWQMSILDTQSLSHLGVSIGKYCLHLDFSIFQVGSSLYDLHSLRDPRNTFGLQSTQIFLVMEGVMLLKWKFIATDCCYLPVASLSSVPLISGSPSLRDRYCLVEMCRGHTLEAGSPIQSLLQLAALASGSWEAPILLSSQLLKSRATSMFPWTPLLWRLGTGKKNQLEEGCGRDGGRQTVLNQITSALLPQELKAEWPMRLHCAGRRGLRPAESFTREDTPALVGVLSPSWARLWAFISSLDCSLG